MADNNVMVYAVVALIIGAVVGVGVGYVVFDKESGPEPADGVETYWFFMQGGDTEKTDNEWYSTESIDAVSAFMAIILENKIDAVLDPNNSNFSVDTIDGKSMINNEGVYTFWKLATYNLVDEEFVFSNEYLSGVSEDVKILSYFYGEGFSGVPTTGWEDKGPFA